MTSGGRKILENTIGKEKLLSVCQGENYNAEAEETDIFSGKLIDWLDDGLLNG